MAMQLRQALEEVSTGALRRIAATHGLPADEATIRAELIERIAERLLDPVYIQEQLDGLAEPQRHALEQARAASGEIRGFVLERLGPDVAAELLDRGLLFRTFAAAGPKRGELFAVPDELLICVPGKQPEPPPVLETAPTERRASDPVVSLFVLASHLHRGSGRLQDEVASWAEEPGGWDWQLRWSFFRHLGQAAGLLVAKPEGGLAVARGMPPALDDPVALAERLWRTYVQDRGWAELAQVGVPRGESLAEPTQVRDAILRVLRRLPEGEWLELRALSNWLERTAPAFVREQLDGQARLLLEPTPWEQLEWPLLRFTLLGPLYWLGRVASSSDGQCISLRGGTRERPREPHTWREDGCLSVPIRTRLGSLLEAERYIALEERGRVSTYRLEQSHVAAALGAGGSIQELRELLRRLTQAPLPHGVEHRLRTWEERFGALTLRPVVVLQARSEADLDAAIAEPAVRQLLSDRLGPSVAEVPAAQVAELAAALRASGHLPRVDAALRLGNAPGRAYPGLVDEQVLEFLLVSLLAFERACPEQLSQLEGAPNLRERLETVFPKARLAELRAVARRLAGDLATHPPRPRRSRRRQNVQ